MVSNITMIERSEYLHRRESTDGKRMETLFRKAFAEQKAHPENAMVSVMSVLKEIPQAKVLLSEVWDEFGVMFGAGRKDLPFKINICGQAICDELTVLNTVIPTAILHQTRSNIEMELARETFANGGHFVAIGSSVGWGPITALYKEHASFPSLALVDANGKAISIAKQLLSRLNLEAFAKAYSMSVFADNVSVEFPADVISTIGFDGHYMSDESFVQFQQSKWRRIKNGGCMLFDVSHDDDEVVRDTLELLLHLKDVSYGGGLKFRYRSVDEALALVNAAELDEADITVYKCGNYGAVIKVEKG
ncbi:hypothetical protein AGMMS49975_15890 [Clostridia bacterium]|nr:hypothetical protein AGMMS49975_15890 [Clostridia bacterium]